MFTKSVRAAIPTSLLLTVFLAAGLIGCTPIEKDTPDVGCVTNEFCTKIQAAEPSLIIVIDRMGNITATHGGEPSELPPMNGNESMPGTPEGESLPVTNFEGSTWFCYKIGGQRRCIKY